MMSEVRVQVLVPTSANPLDQNGMNLRVLAPELVWGFSYLGTGLILFFPLSWAVRSFEIHLSALLHLTYHRWACTPDTPLALTHY